MLALPLQPNEKSLPELVVMPLWQAKQRSEVWNDGCSSCVVGASAQAPAEGEQQSEGARSRTAALAHHQPSVSLPSAQSHSR